ncbi:MAG: hypothetical protein JWL98_1075 [Xanthomonadaceae bacterium]|nr:hypothetical protein [Xanthomonadaceae bacterium]
MRPKYLFGDFELNPASRELLRKGVPIALRPRSLECLIYLIEHRDRAVGRDELIAAVWGRTDASDTVVAQTLLRARKALDDTGNQQVMIRTLPRFGYLWVAPVEEVSIPAGQAIVGAVARVAHALPFASTKYIEGDVVDASDGSSETPDLVPESDAVAHLAPVMHVEHAPADALASGQRRRRLRMGVCLLTALIAAVGAGFYFHSRHQPDIPMRGDDAVLVMPVTVSPMDSENAWVRLGAMDYMAARLRGSGVNVLPSELALRLGTAVAGDAPAVARNRLSALSHAHWIAVPELQRDGDRWLMRLRLFDHGREIQVQGRGDTALAAAAQASDVWLQQLGGQGEAPPPSPLAERLQRLDADIMMGRLQEARRLLRTVSPTDRNNPRMVLREAKLEFRATNIDEAAGLFQKALDEAPAVDMETRVGALQGLAGAERARGNLDAAELRYTQSLTLLQTLSRDHVNSRSTGLAYEGLGIIHAERGDIDAGVRDMGQARVWIQRSGDAVLLGAIGHNIGKAEVLRGDYPQALNEFERSIAIFERFRVDDYLANSLSEKAGVLLALARPTEAAATIHRAQAHLSRLEDDRVVVEVLMMAGRIQIAQGRLRDAADSLVRIRSHGVDDSDPPFLELLLRLALAQGELAQAGALARSGPASKDSSDGLMLAAVQAAARAGDLRSAKAWLASDRSVAEQDARFHAVALELAHALIARAEGDGIAALAHAQRAATQVGVSPDAQIQTGVVEALNLLDARQYDGASAVLGRLEKSAETDYRVAWAMLALYRALGDQRAAAAALGRVNGLRGDRPVAVEPAI